MGDRAGGEASEIEHAARLHAEGVLSDEEFKRLKQRLIDGGSPVNWWLRTAVVMGACAAAAALVLIALRSGNDNADLLEGVPAAAETTLTTAEVPRPSSTSTTQLVDVSASEPILAELAMLRSQVEQVREDFLASELWSAALDGTLVNGGSSTCEEIVDAMNRISVAFPPFSDRLDAALADLSDLETLASKHRRSDDSELRAAATNSSQFVSDTRWEFQSPRWAYGGLETEGELAGCEIN